MMHLYLWTTPNGFKPLLLLEELGEPFELRPVRLDGEQKSPEFTAVNPNQKIPALVDNPGTSDQVTIFESGAILLYLAEKFGRFLPEAPQQRASALSWLFLQVSGQAPNFGNWRFFAQVAEQKNPEAIARFENESLRILQLMDRHLTANEYLAGEYSIADMAFHPWLRLSPRYGVSLSPYPAIEAWIARIDSRPAAVRAYATKFD